MQRAVSWAKHSGRLVYAGGLAGALLCALLLMMGGLPAPAAAEGNTICVGPAGDYATVQAAVDAAQDGDTILVASHTFTENVVITKSVTIGGRWKDDCSVKNAPNETGTAVHPTTGRAFTIGPDQPGVSITVVITDISAVGDATGLGGAEPLEQSATVTFTTGSEAQFTNTLPIAAAGTVEEWREQVVRAAAQSLIPGAPSAEEITARLAGPQAQTWLPELQTQAANVYRPAGTEVDCGGALYAKGAGLRLQNFNAGGVASTTGDGYGGGVCIVEPTAAGVYIVKSAVNQSVGSLSGFGVGGAMFIQGGDDAGSVVLEDAGFYNSIAAPHSAGWGGGLAVVNTPHFKLMGSEVTNCTIATNLASGSGDGLGGGIFLQGVAAAEVSKCRFLDNYASGGSIPNPDKSPWGTAGIGGGIYVEDSPGFNLNGNTFTFNVAQSAPNMFNKGSGGGGAFVVNSSQAVISSNTFDRNTAGFSGTGFGGGLAVIKGNGYPDDVTGITVYSNTFSQNWGTVTNRIGAAGGGLYAYGIDESEVTSNTFTANVANAEGDGLMQMAPFPFGGGLGLQRLYRVRVANNRFEDNVATIGGGGLGGGVGVRAEKGIATTDINIVDNLFLRNLGDGGMIGDGRGGAISVSQGQWITVAHNVMIGNSGVLTTDLEPEKASSVIMLSGMMDTSARPNYVGLLDVIVDSNQILNSGQGLPAAAGLPNNFAIGVQATDRFTITNNLIAGSTLGGIVAIYEFYGDAIEGYVDTHGEIVNNTIYDNGTYGVWLLNRWHSGLMTVTNNIIMGHKYGVEGIDLFGRADPVPLDYSVLYDNQEDIGPEATADGSITATHTVAADPLFFAPARDDYRLLPDSPAIDAGDPAGVPPAPPFDIDGGPRPYGPRVDIGAHEWHGQGYPFQSYLPGISKD